MLQVDVLCDFVWLVVHERCGGRSIAACLGGNGQGSLRRNSHLGTVVLVAQHEVVGSILRLEREVHENLGLHLNARIVDRELINLLVAGSCRNDSIGGSWKNDGRTIHIHGCSLRGHSANCGVGRNSTRGCGGVNILTKHLAGVVVTNGLLWAVGTSQVKSLTLHERNGISTLRIFQTRQGNYRSICEVARNSDLDVIDIDNRLVAGIHQIKTADVHTSLFCHCLRTCLVEGVVKVVEWPGNLSCVHINIQYKCVPSALCQIYLVIHITHQEPLSG